MLSAWILLGSFFFIFMLGMIVYVLTIDVEQPEIARQSRAQAVGSSANGLVADSGKYLISKGYHVVFSPRAFVDYPFGIRVVFAKPDTSDPIIRKPAERTGHRGSNVHRSFQASEYTGWPQSALEDPELTVIGERIEFESETAEPGIRVELKLPRESFKEIKTAEEQVLSREEETVFSLWLHPLEPKTSSLDLVVSLVEGAVKATTSGTDGRSCRELATIALTVPVTFFPIVLR
jgi:hypothetical protein